jgi:site-specific recombinase XerD
MSKKAIKTILSIPDTSKNIGLRDAVMLSLLYTTAIRIEELTSIKLCDLNLDVEFPYVVIKGKGNKIRTLTLPQKMIQLLRRYLAIYHGVTSELDNYLFFSKIKGRMYPITEVGVSKRIKLYGNKARKICTEVPENLHAHQFRHARATHWLDDGLNIAQISRLLGHSSIATTMVYLDITDEMKSTAITSRMNEEIKSIKPKWTNREIKSLLTLFGLKKQTH